MICEILSGSKILPQKKFCGYEMAYIPKRGVVQNDTRQIQTVTLIFFSWGGGRIAPSHIKRMGVFFVNFEKNP